MPRNIALVRTLRIYEVLRTKRQTVYELAATFGVTTRTVRRDLKALESAGVPVQAEQAHGLSTRYSVKGAR